jgi:electron transfer flavoprotein beta subunit
VIKIGVCVKGISLPPQARRLEPQTGRLDPAVRGELNEPDVYTVQAALDLKDSAEGGTVDLVTMGPGSAVDALRRGLAMGADHATLVADDALRGSDLLATSQVLAAVLRIRAPDLTLFGWEASDSNGGMLWASVAENLGLPVVSRVWQLELSGPAVRATRQMEYGFDVVEASMPCVVALAGTTSALRHPSLRDIIASKQKKIEVLALSALGIPTDAVGLSGSRTTVLAVSRPAARPSATVLQDDDQAADRLVTYLIERGLA